MEFMSRVSRVKQFSFVYNSLNNGPIFNLIEILELSQSPLCSQSIHVDSVESCKDKNKEIDLSQKYILF